MATTTRLHTGATIVDLTDGDVYTIVYTISQYATDTHRLARKVIEDGGDPIVARALSESADEYHTLAVQIEEADTIIWSALDLPYREAPVETPPMFGVVGPIEGTRPSCELCGEPLAHDVHAACIARDAGEDPPMFEVVGRLDYDPDTDTLHDTVAERRGER